MQHVPCQMHVFHSQTPKFKPKSPQKKQPGNRYEQIFFFDPKMPKELSEWVPKIIKESTKPKPGPHRVLPCALQCPRIVPGSSQDRPRDLQDAKVEAPSMPNDTHGHHKPEIWSQKCQESGNQEPASQHTFQPSQGGRRQGRSLKIILGPTNIPSSSRIFDLCILGGQMSVSSRMD